MSAFYQPDLSRDIDSPFMRFNRRLYWMSLALFVVALVVTYGLNLVDIILSRPDTGEVKEPATSMQIQKDGFRVVRTFSF
jgi:hypothetical protein